VSFKTTQEKVVGLSTKPTFPVICRQPKTIGVKKPKNIDYQRENEYTRQQDSSDQLVIRHLFPAVAVVICLRPSLLVKIPSS